MREFVLPLSLFTRTILYLTVSMTRGFWWNVTACDGSWQRTERSSFKQRLIANTKKKNIVVVIHTEIKRRTHIEFAVVFTKQICHNLEDMSDYFEEMGWTPLAIGETPNHLMQMARFLRDFGMWDLLGENEKLPPPASKSAVNNLEEIKIESGETKQCPVCLKDFETGNKAKLMPCHHAFHLECIVPWLERVWSFMR